MHIFLPFTSKWLQLDSLNFVTLYGFVSLSLSENRTCTIDRVSKCYFTLFVDGLLLLFELSARKLLCARVLVVRNSIIFKWIYFRFWSAGDAITTFFLVLFYDVWLRKKKTWFRSTIRLKVFAVNLRQKQLFREKITKETKSKCKYESVVQIFVNCVNDGINERSAQANGSGMRRKNLPKTNWIDCFDKMSRCVFFRTLADFH